MNKQARLRIAVQKKGRLSSETFARINQLGTQFSDQSESLILRSNNFEVIQLRDDDIPKLLKLNKCDVGIVGANVFYESIQTPESFQLTPLGFGRCRLSIAGPDDKAFPSIASLQNKRIATSYPYLLQKFLRQYAIDAEIVELKGSVEIAPAIGIADFICDLVATGKTLVANQLKEYCVVMNSQAVCVSKKLSLPTDQSSQLAQVINTLTKGSKEVCNEVN